MTPTEAGTDPRRRALPYGDRAVLLECEDLADTQAMHHWLAPTQSAGVPPEAGAIAASIGEIVPGAKTLLLRLTGPLPPGAADTLVTARPPHHQPVGAAETVPIAVCYDGDDLDEVSALLGMNADDLVGWHTGQDWTVAFCGFMPGFGYLAPTEEPVEVPRRPSPRTRVPPGSVALADTWSAIYPDASPGGWHLIGHTDVTLFDVAAVPPARLHPGMRIRFHPKHRERP